MALAIGARLGPYEIVAPIGAGGMGEVYRARDPRLGRDVAIKVLAESVAADATRLQRFQHGARAVAAFPIRTCSPPSTSAPSRLQEPFSPTPELRDIVLSCGRALGIDLYGVDIIESERSRTSTCAASRDSRASRTPRSAWRGTSVPRLSAPP